ncbi:Thioredoxin-like fold [Lasallia pustulata]|uniref:Thioredoxin-like fold n=1 Tax=Lasallia pustulata TaxID=136370 RepID=A0A1W5CUG3_9LECA|nr:Thioredoxin-like fold [Lasallia pustulata]
MPEISEPAPTEHIAPVSLPRIAINFCTQCKWMLRAAYFAQELLSTFSTSLGEVSLIPSTGGVFTVDIIYAPSRPADETTDTGAAEVKTQTRRLWDRKSEGGFPGRYIVHYERLYPAATRSSPCNSPFQKEVTDVQNCRYSSP